MRENSSLLPSRLWLFIIMIKNVIAIAFLMCFALCFRRGAVDSWALTIKPNLHHPQNDEGKRDTFAVLFLSFALINCFVINDVAVFCVVSVSLAYLRSYFSLVFYTSWTKEKWTFSSALSKGGVGGIFQPKLRNFTKSFRGFRGRLDWER